MQSLLINNYFQLKMNIRLKLKKKKNKNKKILINSLIVYMKIIKNFVKIKKIKMLTNKRTQKMLMKIVKSKLKSKKLKRNLNKRKKNFKV